MMTLRNKFSEEEVNAMISRSTSNVEVSSYIECYTCDYQISYCEPKHLYRPSADSHGTYLICEKCYNEIHEV